jgi:hypothetical protein
LEEIYSLIWLRYLGDQLLPLTITLISLQCGLLGLAAWDCGVKERVVVTCCPEAVFCSEECFVLIDDISEIQRNGTLSGPGLLGCVLLRCGTRKLV